ncbi:MAG: DUF4139 domain-containing protein [Desulfobacterales bacterium]|nr:DUF4139 domain-containing protein [Desulfobacterales bacterium]
MKRPYWFIVLVLFWSCPAGAKIDLVSLPDRDSVQLTIYNSADLTLVRESRELTLQKGVNRMQFSWANTLIDPTSLEMLPRSGAGKIDVFDLSYPPRTENLGVWQIESSLGGKVPMQISYLTSGLSWRPFYIGTLSPNEQTLDLQGYVRVSNASGEDYENAQVRLIVGEVNLLDEIATLARRKHPYGSPVARPEADQIAYGQRAKAAFETVEAEMVRTTAMAAPKKIEKKGVSEYFLYTIEGTETIAHRWSKRLPSFRAGAVPVVNRYKYEEERFGDAVVRFLRIENDRKSGLGQTPVPAGELQVFRSLGEDRRLAFVGRSRFKYIPVGKEADLNLGPVENVRVEAVLMHQATGNYTFFKDGNISGWDEELGYRIQVKNRRPVAAAVEIVRNVGSPNWEIKLSGEYGEYTRVDADSVKFLLNTAPRSEAEFTYTLTIHHGKRAE